MTTENKGVIYYKLDPDYHFEGDYTKNCGLTGGEIDGNFHFLRGYDILSIDVTSNKEELVITRLNGEVTKVNIAKNFADYDFEYDFEYDKKEGVLKITTPYGETIDLEGFLTENFNRVYSDYTISGDGTRYNPLKMADNLKTGTYRPVKTIIDLTDGKSELPTSNNARNDRYLTIEKASKYGLLYPLAGVDAIKKRLEEIGSEWRIPTKEDWDQLLNFIEECPEDKTHDSDLTNVHLGVNAGAYLKSLNKWEPFYRELENGEVVIDGERYTKDEKGDYVPNERGEFVKLTNSEDRFGFTIYPVGFGERRGVESIGGYGKWAAYWTSTEEDKNRDMYVKVFSFDKRTVEQNTWGDGWYLSIRLVKNYNGNNLYDVENIDGINVSTIHFLAKDEAEREDYKTSLIWTKENIHFTNQQYGGVVSPEWSEYDDESVIIRYYINDWDGKQWVRNEVQEGESVVVIDYNNVKTHEWRVIDGVLTDTLDTFINGVSGSINNINKEIENINAKIDESVESLNTKINESIESLDVKLSGNIESLDNKLDESFNNLDAKLEENVESLDTKLDETSKKLQAEINKNKVISGDSGIEIRDGYTYVDEVFPTTIKIKFGENSMIKLDENGYYFDGNYNFNDDHLINNKIEE